ncbi:MAG: hypothetical protein J0H09_05570, partial [Burkholderiales bacterium]|nr:hypothetical protein [Burkholderiales bacterium]
MRVHDLTGPTPADLNTVHRQRCAAPRLARGLPRGPGLGARIGAALLAAGLLAAMHGPLAAQTRAGGGANGSNASGAASGGNAAAPAPRRGTADTRGTAD